MISKILSGIVSALTLSLMYTYISQLNQNTDLAWYYPIESTFLMGFILLILIYFLIGIPLSLFIDMYIPKRNYSRKLLFTYSLFGVLLCILFLLINPASNFNNAFLLIIQFSLAGFLLGFFQIIFSFLLKKLK